MDPAVALVQAYLQLNGYFTVTEYPVVEAMRHGGFRSATDLDILAIRFPTAARTVPGAHGHRFALDEELDLRSDRIDMVIGEVKEGRAELNRGARNPDILASALSRFGCCPENLLREAVQDLLRHGATDIGPGHHSRLVAFGISTDEPLGYPCTVVRLGHVLSWLRRYLEEHWDILRHAQFKQTALSLLVLMQKAGDGRD